MTNRCKLAPSLLAADFLHLSKALDMINHSEADWLHLDVMDGVFVPNISFGFPIIEQVAQVCNKPLDVHLMTVEPQQFISTLQSIGVYMVSIHYEICVHLHRTIWKIKEAGMKAGIGLNPHTPIEWLEDIVQDIDLVLLMTVNPGFGGQPFIEHSVDKVRRMKEMIVRKNAAALIEVDGGIDLRTGKLLVDAGADVLVTGSFVFNSDHPIQTIYDMKQL